MDRVEVLSGPRPDDVLLAEVAAYEFSASRRAATREDVPNPSADITMSGHQLSADSLELTLVLKADITFPLGGDAVAAITCSVYGKFRRSRPFDEETVAKFRDLDG